VKLTKSRKKENIDKERSRRKTKKKEKKVNTKENSRERWQMIKEQTRQPNL
jgi:hypothetical protein